MNKRQAKRHACYLVGAMAEDAIVQNFESVHEDADGNALSNEDTERVKAAVQEIADEMFRRWGGSQPTRSGDPT